MAANAALKEQQKGTGVDKAHPNTGTNVVVNAQLGLISMTGPDGAPRKKIALCGFASSSRDAAPFQEPDWAIVGMNQLYRHIPRADAWFEIHREWNTALVPGTDHAGWLADCGIPVLMTDQVPGIPTSVKLPMDRLIDKFSDYYTSTVAYMVAYFTDYIDREVERRLAEVPSQGSCADVLALARSMYQEYTIGIFGIDLVVGDEYFHQKPCAEYHIGNAIGRGITVMIPPQSALLTQRYRYGFQMEPDDTIKDSDIEKRRNELVAQQQQHLQASAEMAGALKELNLLGELRTLRERGAKVGL